MLTNVSHVGVPYSSLLKQYGTPLMKDTTLKQVRADDIQLDSAFFIAFEMTHRALKSGLNNKSSLSVTQYRTLVKLLPTLLDGIPQSSLGVLLNLKANVVTQAVNALVEGGFAVRSKRDGDDGRLRMVHITETGLAHVAEVNNSIVERLYTQFPTKDAAYRDILEAAIAAGASIDPPLPNETTLYPASRALVSLELVKQAMECTLRRTCGASLSECRILQRLGEVGEPLRIGDIAEQLQLSAVTVARAADRMAARGWIRRLASPHDRKAVFVDATQEGKRQQKVIGRTIKVLARTLLWNHLHDDQRRALARTWQVVIADLQARKEAERKAALGLLQPID